MKNVFIYIFLLFLISVLLISHICYKNNISYYDDSETNSFKSVKEPSSISLYLVDKDKTIILNYEDYILGIVSNEISPDYNIEAIKAQTVAVRSFVLNKIYCSNKNTYDLHKGAQLCNSSHCINWCTFDKTVMKWNNQKRNEYKEKFRTALSETTGEYISYNSAPAITFWHKISHGKTENSLDILGHEYPYHKSVPSEFDKKAPGYITRVIYTKDAFGTIMSGLGIRMLNTNNISNDMLGEITRTPGGCVTEIQILNHTYSGQEIMNAFKLNSTFFTIVVDDLNVVFEVKGCGHNVGLSQYGANIMAITGSSYKDILNYYYPNAIISSLIT